MGATQIKEELHNFIEEGDSRLIKMLHTVAKEYSYGEAELSEEQLEELNIRIEKYDAGQMNFSSWDTVRDRVSSGSKNA